MTEADFQRMVVDAAHLFGWRVAHFRPVRTARRWRTPVAYDGAGFPDLVLARRGRVIFAELKTDRGRLSIPQKEWIEDLPNAYVWRPADWDRIEALLRG